MTNGALYEGLISVQGSWHMSGSDVANFVHVSAATVKKWTSEKKIITSHGVDSEVKALIHLLVIHRHLQSMYPGAPQEQWQWLSRHHPQLGRVPLDLIYESVGGLLQVREFLDALPMQRTA